MNKYRFGLLALATVLIVALSSPGLANANWGGPKSFTVTITNVTKGQIFSPPVVLVHNQNFTLFELGDTAEEFLYTLAEDGQTALLEEFAEHNANVYYHTVASGPVMPGQSIDIQVESRGRSRFVTVLGMLVSSNDAFFAVRNLPLKGFSTGEGHAIAYDAGSEMNSEDCSEIPGPPCGNGGVRNTVGAEGFIHVHNGIHGIADIDPAEYDWRSPVATISINR